MHTTSRRGHGDDSIYYDHRIGTECLDARHHKSCSGRWRGVVSLGEGPDGTRLRRKVSGRTQAEVKDKLRALHEELSKGLHTWDFAVVLEGAEGQSSGHFTRCLAGDSVLPLDTFDIPRAVIGAGGPARTFQARVDAGLYTGAVIDRQDQHLVLSPAETGAFAPSGTLRAAINLGNPILASKDPVSGHPFGVSVDLACELAGRLGVPVELVTFDEAAASVDAVRNEQADVGFFAIDPARSQGLVFTAPYVLIEGSYLVRDSSPLTDNAQVDSIKNRISVGSGSAYDLFLTREIRQAEIIRVQGAGPALAAARAGDVEVAAGIRQVLESEARREPGVRVLPGCFMVIAQAVGAPASRGGPAQAALATFVEQMKASGFVADALKRHRIEGAIVAPAA